MKSSARHAIVWVLAIFCIPGYTQSQTRPSKKGPASSISGRVTIKGKAAPGIVVGLRVADSDSRQTSGYKGVTNHDGYYRITNVSPGTYQVIPAAPAFVISGEQGRKTLIITEGESVEGIDFALTRGGVITGRVTDSEGRPLIEEPIIAMSAESKNQDGPVYMISRRNIQTDDRGIYRIFGLPQGKYKVAVGDIDYGFIGGRRRPLYKQTFHPAVSDSAKATVVEVTEGNEATNVDIIVGRALDTFAVSGRFVNGDTGQPLPNVEYGLQKIAGNGNTHSSSGAVSNSQGEFKLENLMAGKYLVFMVPGANSDLRADAVPFDVIDRDVTGLLVKTSKGASVSGVIIFTGTDDKTALPKLSQMQLYAHVREEAPGTGRVQTATINQDGTFRIGGLQSGMAHFSLGSNDGRAFREFTIARVERDGVAQPGGLEVNAGEHVTGVRLVVSYGTGTIRGVVKVENGELPATAVFSVWLKNLASDPTRSHSQSMPAPQVDARGHFLAEMLLPGTYEVSVNLYIPGWRRRLPSAKQQVNVADGVVTEVTVTMDLNPNSGPDN